MVKRRIFIFIIIGLVIVGIGLGAINYLKYVSNYKDERRRMQEQAVSIAQAYLDQTYQQEMIYLERFYHFTELFWSIYFFPSNNKDIVFRVDVNEQEDKSVIPEERVRLSGWETYYDKYFEYKLQELFEPDMEAIWGTGTECGVAIYGHISIEKYPSINEFSSLDEVKDILQNNYALFLKIPNLTLKEDYFDDISQKILDTLNKLEYSDYRPNFLFIEGNVIGENNKNQKSIRIDFNERDDFMSVSQIKEYISSLFID